MCFCGIDRGVVARDPAGVCCVFGLFRWSRLSRSTRPANFDPLSWAIAQPCRPSRVRCI